jgi:hypothetical protein
VPSNARLLVQAPDRIRPRYSGAMRHRQCPPVTSKDSVDAPSLPAAVVPSLESPLGGWQPANWRSDGSRPQPASHASKPGVCSPVRSRRSETSPGHRPPPLRIRQVARTRLWSRPTRFPRPRVFLAGVFSRVRCRCRYIGGSRTTWPASTRRRNPGGSGCFSQCR